MGLEGDRIIHIKDSNWVGLQEQGRGTDGGRKPFFHGEEAIHIGKRDSSGGNPQVEGHEEIQPAPLSLQPIRWKTFYKPNIQH